MIFNRLLCECECVCLWFLYVFLYFLFDVVFAVFVTFILSLASTHLLASLSLSLHVQSCAFTNYNERINSENSTILRNDCLFIRNPSNISRIIADFHNFRLFVVWVLREGNRLLKRCDSRQRTTENMDAHIHAQTNNRDAIYSVVHIGKYLFNIMI